MSGSAILKNQDNFCSMITGTLLQTKRYMNRQWIATLFFLLPLFAGAKNNGHHSDYLPAVTDSLRVEQWLAKAESLENSAIDSSYWYYTQAMNLAKRSGNKYQQVTAMLNIGIIHIRKGAYDTARQVLNDALLIAVNQKLNSRASALCNNIGNTYLYQNMPGKALDYYFKAAHYAAGETKRLATIYGNITSIFWDMQQLDKALEYGEKAISFSLQANDSMAIAGAYLNTGNVLKKKEQWIKARSYYENALRFARNTTDIANKMICYQNLASLLNMTKHPVEAQRYADSSLMLARQLPATHSLSYALNLNGIIQFEQGHYEAAKKFYREAEEAAKKSGNWKVLRETYYNWARLEKATREYEAAYAHLEKYAELKDSTLSEETAKAISLVEGRYQSEAKQQQIGQLEKEKLLQATAIRQKNTINYLLLGALVILAGGMAMAFFMYRQKQQLQQKVIAGLETEKQLTASAAILKGQEEERRRLAKDLHDGLGGMLSGIKYALQKTGEKASLSGPASTSFNHSVEMLDTSIVELRRIAHNLAPEALMKYGISAAISDYCTSINNTGILKVTFQSVNMEQFRMDPAKSNIVFRIVQELLNNTLKHAAARTAIVQLTREDNNLSVTVEDDGIGFDREAAGLTGGMGWTNIRTRVSYLKGQLDIKSEPGKGTYVHFAITV